MVKSKINVEADKRFHLRITQWSYPICDSWTSTSIRHWLLASQPTSKEYCTVCLWEIFNIILYFPVDCLFRVKTITLETANVTNCCIIATDILFLSSHHRSVQFLYLAASRSLSGGSHKLVSAAVRCVGPSWRHTKVRRATSRIFENGGVIVFYVNTLSLFFPVNEAAMWFPFSSRIPLPHIPTEKVSVFWLLLENSAKKVAEAFWWLSKLGKLCECGEEFRSTKTRFSLDKKYEKTCSFAPK